jgi:hypothetical protein
MVAKSAAPLIGRSISMKNLFTARSLLSGLNSGQKEFLSRKTVKGSATASEWLRRMDELVRLDRVIGSAVNWSVLLLMIGILLGVVGGVAQFWWMLGIGAVMALFGFAFLITFSGKDLHDNLRRFVVPVIGLLNEDMGEKTPLALDLNLLGRCVKSKRTGVRSWPKSELPRGVTGCTDSVYADPWLNLNTKLVDGTRLGFSITEHLLERKKSKRSASGKYKQKFKYKNKQTVTLRLRPAGADYLWRPDLVAASEAGQWLDLGAGMAASIKSDPGKPATLLLRREKKQQLHGVPGKGDTDDPRLFVELMGRALSLVGPPPSPPALT